MAQPSAMPRFYFNILKVDTGYAPNPFYGVFTLACCRPEIRRAAGVGDWVVGITRKHLGNDIAYMMRVDEVLAHADYFRDKRFTAKKPDFSTKEFIDTLGDNCYRPLPDGGYQQLPCRHYNFENNCESVKDRIHDTDGVNVLISWHLTYYGEHPEPLDKAIYGFAIPARFNRVNFTPDQEEQLLKLVTRRQRGRMGRPRNWEGADSSWREKVRCT